MRCRQPVADFPALQRAVTAATSRAISPPISLEKPRCCLQSPRQPLSSGLAFHFSVLLREGASVRIQCSAVGRWLLAVVILGGAAASSALAVTYQFLNVASTGATTSQFTSANGNGVINVSQIFSAGGAGVSNNINTAIFPSQFTTLFPGTGQVQGHLTQTNRSATSVVSFDLTGYNLSASTVFGIWNITNEVTTPVYQVRLLDAANVVQPPSTFNLIGNQDNQTQVAGRHLLVMNTATGVLGLGALINAGGTHTDAAFWDNIPLGTKQINVSGNVPNTGNGDGVGYYFAEVVPEPASMVLLVLGVAAGGTARCGASVEIFAGHSSIVGPRGGPAIEGGSSNQLHHRSALPRSALSPTAAIPLRSSPRWHRASPRHRSAPRSARRARATRRLQA